jgi:hypothetical protein
MGIGLSADMHISMPGGKSQKEENFTAGRRFERVSYNNNCPK